MRCVALRPGSAGFALPGFLVVFFPGGGGRGVDPVFGHVSSDEFGHFGVVFLEGFSGANVVVDAVGGAGGAVSVEPALDGFGPVFVGVGHGVGVFPEAFFFGVVVEFVDGGGEVGIDVGEASVHDGVGEFVDEDGLSVVAIGGVGEDVFFGARNDGDALGGSEAAGAGVPVGVFVVFEEVVLGDVEGDFVFAHDDEAHFVFDHLVFGLGGLGEHGGDDAFRFDEGFVGDVFGAEDGEAVGVDVFLVEGV